MILDLLVLAVLLAAAIAGAVTGLVRQLSRLVAAALALGGARALGPMLAPPLASVVPSFAAGVAAHAIAFVGLYLALALLLGWGARALRAAGGVPAAVDRGGGALLGGAKAALVAWVLVSALVAWGRPVPGTASLHAEASGFAAFARERNALGGMAAPRERRPMTAREKREAAAAEWRGTAAEIEPVDGR